MLDSSSMYAYEAASNFGDACHASSTVMAHHGLGRTNMVLEV